MQKLLVQMVAGDLVERAERLVHQQELGLEAERARDRDALLHAARELPGEFALEPVEPDHGEVALGARGALLGGHAHDLERQHDVALDAAPGIERGRLEHIAVGARDAALRPGSCR